MAKYWGLLGFYLPNLTFLFILKRIGNIGGQNKRSRQVVCNYWLPSNIDIFFNFPFSKVILQALHFGYFLRRFSTPSLVTWMFKSHSLTLYNTGGVDEKYHPPSIFHNSKVFEISAPNFFHIRKENLCHRPHLGLFTVSFITWHLISQNMFNPHIKIHNFTNFYVSACKN